MIGAKERKMPGPISPQDIDNTKNIPEEVFEVVNALLEKNFSRGRAVIFEADIVSTLVTRYNYSRDQIYGNHWLDFEEAYRDNGWEVKYDKPGYNESYEPSFEFIAKKKDSR